jgi:hypothetical protein
MTAGHGIEQSGKQLKTLVRLSSSAVGIRFLADAEQPKGARVLMNSELTADVDGYTNHSRSSICRASLSAYFANTSSASRAAAGFVFTRKSWVKLWLIRARPLAVMASAVRGMSVVSHKESTDPCMRCSVLYCRTLRPACSSTTTPASGPGRSGDRLHNCTGQACLRQIPVLSRAKGQYRRRGKQEKASASRCR